MKLGVRLVRRRDIVGDRTAFLIHASLEVFRLFTTVLLALAFCFSLSRKGNSS